MHGLQLLETIRSLPTPAAAAVMLRHAERFPILVATDHTLVELTPNGAVAAEAFGARIDGFDCVRIFHSPVKRCRQTAESIARGVSSTGCPVPGRTLTGYGNMRQSGPQCHASPQAIQSKQKE